MIKNVDFQSTMEDAFLKYAASVAQERAIPDVRDCLKIGLRQGLYAQFTNKLTYHDKLQKAQKSVAAAMAQSYVHGDAAMYDTFIRAARPWSYRYPLEDVQGNYGNPTAPDNQAAARYVEMRAGEITDVLFAGLKKNAVDEWYDNYDSTELIPSVFPSIGYWNIVNGCSGIAVAMATSVPQFNLTEVNNALIKLIKNPDCSFDEIYCAPDFATGSTIVNADAVKQSLAVGEGESIRIRAKLEYLPKEHAIRATQLPYGVFTDTIIENQLKPIVENDPDYGIVKVMDHTKKEADIYIYLAKEMTPQQMIEKLYKDTSLENYFSINMIMLDTGRFPKVFGWKEACQAYIDHIRACKRREIQFELNKALARLNVVEGLIIAAASIDEVIKIIRGSNDPKEAAAKLIARFKFNDEQVAAILAMKLSSLTKIDGIKLNDEREKIKSAIDNYRYILNENTALDQLLIDALNEVSNKFGDSRRTKLENLIEKTPELEEKNVIVQINGNSIRVIDTQTKTRKKTDVIYTTNFDSLMLVTDKGLTYAINLSSLELNREYKISSLCNISDDETILLLINSTAFYAYDSLLTISKNGFIKRSKTNEYGGRLKKGVVAAKLEDNDTLVGAYLVSKDDNYVLIVSNNNYYNYYPVSSVSITGRATKGVKAIKLNEDEYIAKTNLEDKNDNLTTTNRGVKGVKYGQDI